MTEYKSFIFNDFGVNAYIIFDETREAVLIDPAVNSQTELATLTQFVADNNLTVKYIINTHGHPDHICGNDRAKAEYKVPVLANFKDNELVANAINEARMFGFPMNMQSLPDKELIDGDIVNFGNTQLKVFEVPGHSQGSIALYCEEANFVVTGDALFQASIGRTDLPGGNYKQLITAIKEKLLTLNDNCKVLPGHGASSTISSEKIYNPFF